VGEGLNCNDDRGPGLLAEASLLWVPDPLQTKTSTSKIPMALQFYLTQQALKIF
jgi:hypothetical protein